MIPLPAYQGKKIAVFGLGKSGQATVEHLLASGAEVYAWDDKEVASGSSPLEGERASKEPKATKRAVGGKSLKDTPHDSASALRASASSAPPQGGSCAALHLIPDTQWPWKELTELVLSPGVPLTHPEPHRVVQTAKKHQVPVIGDIELLYRAQPDATYVGITGTNGKSTTTALIGHILKEAGKNIEVGGNLGTPALTFAPLGKEGVYVLELSSYQLDLLQTARMNVACLLNLTPDHLDRHGDMDGYLAAKKHIFDRQRKDDTAVVAVDDAYTDAVAKELLNGKRMRVIPVAVTKGVRDGVYVKQGILHDTHFSSPLEGEQASQRRAVGGESNVTPHASAAVASDLASAAPPQGGSYELSIDLRSCRALKGTHNWQNASVAYAACRALGVDAAVIERAMHSFPGLAHRMEWVAEKNGVAFINDSKATNADAAAKALGCYDAIYWIAGGRPKAGGITTLGHYFPRIRHAFLVGEAEEEFARTLEGHVSYTRCKTLDVAVQHAAQKAFADAVPGAVVLLSPACASWDQWANFEARGDAFREYVRKAT